MKTKIKTKFLALVLSLVCLLGCISVSAEFVKGGDALSSLKYTISTGTYTCKSTGKKYDFTTRTYKLKEGGVVRYMDLVGFSVTQNSDGTHKIGEKEGRGEYFSSQFENLTNGAKQDLLKDVFAIGNAVCADGENGYLGTGDVIPTDETMTDFMNYIQSQSGMGSQLLATLMSETKPDYVSANRLYAPFSGVVGTILGIISVLIMALLGITMALDIAFITIPAFQLAMGADGSGEGGADDSKKMSRLISQEARQAVQISGDAGGKNGQSGDDKMALGVYFKKRWKGLVLLGICLLYLVQGQIYTLVGWIIDLLSGFLGF